MVADLVTLRGALHLQWARIIEWLGPWGDDLGGKAEEPSVLPGWTCRDLVAHLARAMDALTVCQPAPAGTVPQPLAEYLGTYPQRANDIRDTTVALAGELGPHPLAAVAARGARALDHLDALGSDGTAIVRARRAPVTLRDMAASRLIELVVHADDLVRSLGVDVTRPRVDAPVDPHARQLVADELLAIVTAREGWRVRVRDPHAWIALATGRAPYNVSTLAAALAPEHASDSLPDLGRSIPVL